MVARAWRAEQRVVDGTAFESRETPALRTVPPLVRAKATVDGDGGPLGRSPGETRLTGLTGGRARTGATVIDRLGSFSDGVFAIAINLLVLDLDIPSLLTEAGLQRALRGLGSELFSFALSFSVIGRFWMGHVWVFRRSATGTGGSWGSTPFPACDRVPPVPD